MISTSTAILIGAGFATLGWVYTARRARTLARTQHTLTAMLTVSFNQDFRKALRWSHIVGQFDGEVKVYSVA